MRKTYDILIVGSGVAGALAAHRFLDKGLSVLMLEAGPEPASRDVLVSRYQKADIKVPSVPYPDSPQAPRPDVSKPQDYYVQKGPSFFNSSYERLVGGSTWHWLGSCLRLVPEDFKLKSTFGVGADWPITYEQLAPYYDRAEKFLNVAGDNDFDLDSPRQSKYPSPPVPVSYLDKVIRKRIEGTTFQGRAFKMATNPQARNPKTCLGSNSCVPICPVGAKYEAYKDIKSAVQKGLHLVSKAVASKIDIDSLGAVESITYQTWDGTSHKASAKHFILAAGGIETPKLLLNSKSENVPLGVANLSDMVGRNLMDHPVQLGWALMPEKVWPFRGPLSTSGFEQLRTGTFRKKVAASRLEIHNDGWGWAEGGPVVDAAKFVEQGLRGKKLKEVLQEHCLAQVSIATLLEQLPQSHNRVTLSQKKDALGIPRPEIFYKFTDYEFAGLDLGKAQRQKFFKGLGCKEIRSNDLIFGAGHIMGTTKMGISPKDSVVDSWGQSHDHKNLSILGSSNFPTAGTANPTLTLVALAERTCDRIMDRNFT
ncbi:GMC family oxidoreductase [Pseudobacteriovorax antillogorgiicola]|uniref:Choline dehydrogenase n=1 Tax=Pseudobacteriovorax antillogorgiicola TaxID=1513793 RepID=A0A1Y6CHX4_9BACT|nr:GMC family oxidoreductase [Pseudobacteriovorax antillogorgiicola]TCS47034.1 choline dehydrogenase-like flavoprotein [Pseudobacteriovorax antillogorgiicola]SMF65353.1 Choline dehydrogenase [Pseudobacteriovorax antillogorgiicola]